MNVNDIAGSPCAICGTTIKLCSYNDGDFFCEKRCSYGGYIRSGDFWMRIVTKDDFTIEFFSDNRPVRIGPKVNFSFFSKSLELDISPLDAKDWVDKVEKLYYKIDKLKTFT